MSRVQDWQPFEISLFWASPVSDPEMVLDQLSAPSAERAGQPWDAVVLDADERGIGEVVSWASRFHDACMRRQGQPDLSAWERADLVADRPRAVAPALVVLASPAQLERTTAEEEARLLTYGAMLYERPLDLRLGSSELTAWLSQELNQLYMPLRTDGEEFLSGDSVPSERSGADLDLPREPEDHAAYVDPVYRLSDEDFEALLRRTALDDPLATGE